MDNIILITMSSLFLITITSFIILFINNIKITKEKNELKSELELKNKEIELLEKNKTIEIDSYKNQIKNLEEIKKELVNEFTLLSSKVLDISQAKAEKNLDLIISPFKEEILGFNKKLDSMHIEHTKQRTSLQQEITSLKEWNNVISQEASNLTKALLNDNKKMGDWGENILKKLLQSTGLREGHEFHTQKSFSDNTESNNKRLQPDIIINMPDDKDIIIDSKVSIKSYFKYVSSENKEDENKYIKELLNSISTHIRSLAGKKYHTIYDLNSLDFVIMFIPVESVFLLAMEKDPELLEKAYRNNILLTSPSSLFAVLRGIQNVWRISHQSKNMNKIIEQITLMNEKFNNFVIDIEDIGNSLNKMNDSYNKARNKLFEGNGNLVKKSKEIMSLGLKK